MPEVHLIRRIRNRPADIFDLVADVEKYPEFINLISALRITKTLSDTEFEAEAIVAYKMISESFQSHILVDKEALRIEVKKAEKGGAVKSLINRWQFYPLNDGSTLVDVVVDVSDEYVQYGRAFTVRIVILFKKYWVNQLNLG